MPEKRLRLAPNLVLPIDFATEGVIVTGMRGSGKSNTEVRFAEVLYDAGVPFCAIDPKGDWDGIRSSADGKSPGLSVPVFGGLRGDFPMEAGMGRRVADLLVDEMLSAILDVSHLSKTGELPRFLVDFCNQLMHRHQLEPHVRTVILEEAHRYIPQNVTAKMAALKEAAAALLLEGRAWGLGCWAATQRPARLNKDVVEEVGTAIIHRIGIAATNDKRTIGGWMKSHEFSEVAVDSLTTLKDGEAWVLSSDFGMKQVQMDRRRTFDSAATPKAGKTLRRPATMADIDQAAIKEALAEAIERAKAEDPKALRQRIRDLEKQIASARPQVVEKSVEIEVVREVIPDVVREALKRAEQLLSDLTNDARHFGIGLAEATDATRAGLVRIHQFDTKVTPAKAAAVPRTVRKEAAPTPAPRKAPERPQGDANLNSTDRKVLTVLAQYPEGRAYNQIALLTGLNAKSQHIRNVISSLRTRGLVSKGQPIQITDAGLTALGDYEPLPTGRALIDWWINHLDGTTGKVLRAYVDAYPEPLSPQEAAEATGLNPDSQHIRNVISRLRTLTLLEGTGVITQAHTDLMEA